MIPFLNAVIDAEGIDLDSTPKANDRGGRSASASRSVWLAFGNLLIGRVYTNQLGLHPGDEVRALRIDVNTFV